VASCNPAAGGKAKTCAGTSTTLVVKPKTKPKTNAHLKTSDFMGTSVAVTA
jgi:hypothetical protein